MESTVSMVQRCFTLLLVALFTSANALAAGEVEISFSPASGSHYEMVKKFRIRLR